MRYKKADIWMTHKVKYNANSKQEDRKKRNGPRVERENRTLTSKLKEETLPRRPADQ